MNSRNHDIFAKNLKDFFISITVFTFSFIIPKSTAEPFDDGFITSLPKDNCQSNASYVWKPHHDWVCQPQPDWPTEHNSRTQIMLDIWLHANCFIPYGNDIFTIPKHAHHPNTTWQLGFYCYPLMKLKNKSQPSCLETRMFLKWKWNEQKKFTYSEIKNNPSSLTPQNSTSSLRWRWENWCHTINFTKPPAWWPSRQRWMKMYQLLKNNSAFLLPWELNTQQHLIASHAISEPSKMIK